MSKRLISFFLGVIFGFQGVRLATHAFYLTVISGLIIYMIVR